MTPPPFDESARASAARRIDAVCSRFESACRHGGRPLIEQYLSDVPPPERPAALRELLLLELAYAEADAARTCDNYLRRFPDHAAVVREALQARDDPADPDVPRDETPTLSWRPE